MVSEFRLPLYNYITTSIEVPYHPNEQVFFPLHQDMIKNPDPINKIKQAQIKEILDNKHYRSEEKKRDIGLLNAAINWFEKYSNSFLQKNPFDHSLESSIIIIYNEKSYTLIPIESYFELKMQIQLSVLQNIPEKEQRKWTGRYSNMFISETIDKIPFDTSKKCRVFMDLEKRIENTLIKINKSFKHR